LLKRRLSALAIVGVVALLGASCAKSSTSTSTVATEGACKPSNVTALARPDYRLASLTRPVTPRILAQGAKRVVKLGVFGDLTGKNSQLVIHTRNSVIMATEEENAKGDLPVRLEVATYDNKDGGPAPAPALAQKAIGDSSVVGVVGPAFSGETASTGALFESAGLTHVTPSATRIDLTRKGWRTFFRDLANDSFQGNAAGDLLIKVMKCKTIALIDDKSAYGAGLADAMVARVRSDGGSIVLRQGIEPTTDYTSVVDSVLSKKPDAVYYAGYSTEASLLVKQYRQRGGKAVFSSGDGSKDTTFISGGKPGNDGTVFTCPCVDPTQTDDATLKAFGEKYEKRFKIPAGIYAAEGWDAAQILIQGIRVSGANVTRPSVLKGVTNEKNFKGVTKIYSWDANHEDAAEDLQIFAYVLHGDSYKLAGTVASLVKKTG
jgi:branched-chain amino acid transport system substrate-binding protein